ncbi:hypothetical protein [Vibrio fluvialis]|uniref:hypothetical protein n=1 Tax=Vibrio fluvialis TaxID=676 RepID=UPI001302B2DD|nr:hypothetical protein [Vibrio fluvialis]EKO3388945.1 hypothetical protein [Vibrio fluvialis]
MMTLRKLSHAVHELLLSDNRPVGNPSEYAKRQMFWDTVKKLDCDILEVSAFLISKADAMEQTVSSKKVQKIDDGINAQEKVLKTPKKIWEQIELHLLDDDAATPALMSILQVAKNPTKLPSEKQSTVLVKLLSRYSTRFSHESSE